MNMFSHAAGCMSETIVATPAAASTTQARRILAICHKLSISSCFLAGRIWTEAINFDHE
jgi:hypothetical protein